MSDLFVVADVHGRFDSLVELLKKANVINDELERNPDVRCGQVGDLLNAVAADIHGDNQCLDHAQLWFDWILVGNHEYPYLNGPHFSGFFQDPVLMHRYRSLVSQRFVKPAHLEGDILITHAGVVDDMPVNTAREAYYMIEQSWGENQLLPVFSAIGYKRGGVNRFGGIFWADYQEPKNKEFNQIFGHNAYVGVDLQENPSRGTFRLNLDGDVRGKNSLAGVWIRDGKLGEIIEYVPETLDNPV